jgi:antitoxin CcdA
MTPSGAMVRKFSGGHSRTMATRRHQASSPILSAAINASCGMLTLPYSRIGFLPPPAFSHRQNLDPEQTCAQPLRIQSAAPASPSRQARRARRPANLSLDAALVTEAKALGVNLSAACESGLAAAVQQARAAQWQAENREPLESSNAWVEANGLPLAHLRLF